MPTNKFLANNIMIKNKSLPLYERNGIYNLKMRKYKNLDTLHAFTLNTSVLTKNVKCGSLWDTIKNIFKKGKNAVKKTMDYIDTNPLFSTVKDIASDYVYEKTGVNPNDYYGIAKQVVNSDDSSTMKALTETANKTIKNMYENRKKPVKPGVKGPSKKEQLKTFMTDFSQNLAKQIPEEKKTITDNISMFSEGINELASGSINLDVWKKKAPLFLLSNLDAKGGNLINEKIKDILKKTYKITDMRLPPTMKKILMKGSTGRLYQGHGDELSEGRLHQGSGDDEGCGKKQNLKYAKLLASL